MTLTRRKLIRAAGCVCVAGNLRAQTSTTRSFWLFKLLNPASLAISPFGTARLHCATAEKEWIVEGDQSVTITPDMRPVRITGPAGQPVSCLLEVPNVIRRNYFAVFDVRGDGCVVLPVVTMDCEIAASCIIGAELPVYAAPLAALAAQAVVSRSVLFAVTKPRHGFADFCDTTHCQFLRSPAPPSSIAARAVRETAGLGLFQRGQVMLARYSAACGGKTEAGIDHGREYVSVSCEICRDGHIERRGHGWGLCQEGAIGLGRLGWSWRAILTKYYPNANVGNVPDRS